MWWGLSVIQRQGTPNSGLLGLYNENLSQIERRGGGEGGRDGGGRGRKRRGGNHTG